jgi:hypothetical protein
MCLGTLAEADLHQPETVQATGTISLSPLPQSIPLSADFTVTANNEVVPVQHYRDRNVAIFSAQAKVVLKIKINVSIEQYSIHPTSFGLKGTVEADTLTLSLTPTLFDPQPAYLLIKINNLEILVVLVDPPEENVPSPHDPGVQDVADSVYAADQTGKVLATIPIQSAIDQASLSGGGIVYVPPGLYRVQSLIIKSGVTLYLAAGAVIQGTDRIADFAGDVAYRVSSKKDLPPVIEVTDYKSVAIRGRGLIDAADTVIYNGNTTPEEVEPKGPYHRVAVRVSNGDGFTVDGVTLLDSAGWSLFVNRVENIRITRLKLLGPMWSGNDGIDICGQNAVVDNCFVYTGDDNFCTKAVHANYPVHDIHFNNSVGYSNSGGVKVGMQVLSEQSEICFDNVDIIHAGRGLVVESRAQSDGGDQTPCPIQNVYFTDIRVEQ